MNKLQKIVNFFFELNEAKRTPRSGWPRLGIKNPESLAEHSCGSAHIAYILGVMEGVDAQHCAVLALFHDIGEVRTGDENWISRIYCDKSNAEDRALRAQIDGLPLDGGLKNLLNEMIKQDTKEAIVAKDADILDLVVQAKVYIGAGCPGAQLFIDSNKPNLKTASAKKLLPLIEKGNLENWWLEIPEINELAKKLNIKQNKRS